MAFTKAPWWIEDSAGRRIGYLHPEDMVVILETYYGHRKWISMFCRDFGYSRSAIDRWKEGKTPIPQDVAMQLNMLMTLKNHGLALTRVEAPWLPGYVPNDDLDAAVEKGTSASITNA